MSNMVHLTYFSDPSLEKWADRAATVWNDVLKDLTMLHPWPREGALNVSISWSRAVRTAENPTRVAQCLRHSVDKWKIELDGSGQTKWALSGWKRFWGAGEDPYMALLHEFGHVFGIPHSQFEGDVMHEDIGGDGKLRWYEHQLYRRDFLAAQSDTSDDA